MVDVKESKQKDTKDDEKRSNKEILGRIPGEIRKLTQGFVFAGLESLSVAADMTSTFIDETTKQEDSKKSGKIEDKLKDIPKNLSDAFFQTLDKSIDEEKKIVDRFYEKYKNA
jgi:hypothetical protein|tara:strand:+ start:246 stop:584 length:339 start_codon:yes stop_codon:yes gene_type:complete